MNETVRTTEQLQEFLDGDFGWRVKEMSDIRTAARRADTMARTTLVRAGIALAYAHWEGFVKKAANAYVRYISCQGLRHVDLRTCFVALSLRRPIWNLQSSRKAEAMIAALESVVGEQAARAKLKKAVSIGTESNLSSSVFRDMACWLGLDVGHYETKWQFIDERLLKRRNSIAHGSGGELVLTQDEFEELVHDVVQLLRWFKTDIENAVSTEAFRSGSVVGFSDTGGGVGEEGGPVRVKGQ